MITARASKSGIDVKKARDYEVAFDASFPTLRVIKHGSFSVPAAPSFSESSTVVEHGLGFFPMFMVFKNTGGSWALYYSANLRISKERLFWAETNETLSGYYFIFDFDLDNPEKYEIVKTGSPKNKSESKREDAFGLRTVDQTNELLFSSEYMQPLVAVVGHGAYNIAPGYITIKHGLGYPPQFWLYMKNLNGDSCYQMVISSATDFLYYCDNDIARFATLYNNSEYSFIIMKDPIGA